MLMDLIIWNGNSRASEISKSI